MSLSKATDYYEIVYALSENNIITAYWVINFNIVTGVYKSMYDFNLQVDNAIIPPLLFYEMYIGTSVNDNMFDFSLGAFLWH